MSSLEQLKADALHLAVNLNLNAAAPLIFYFFEGFYGWRHLAWLFIWSLIIYTWDDVIERRMRDAPVYLMPLTFVAAMLQPLLTGLILLGELLINLKDLLRPGSRLGEFLCEVAEGPGNTLIYVCPFLVPLGVADPWLWLAVAGFVTYINSVGHKIGHQETRSPGAHLALGFTLATVVGLAYGDWSHPFTWTYLILSLAALPAVFVKPGDKLYRKMIAYNLVWQTIMGPLGFIYAAAFLV